MMTTSSEVISQEPRIELHELELLTANPGPYGSPLKWRLRMEATQLLSDPMSISFVWVGSSRSSAHDQVLDTFDVGPFLVGITEFELECDGPNLAAIPREDVLGVTVLFLSFSFRGQEFLRVGYYTQVAYFNDEMNAYPPPEVVPEQLGHFLVMNQPAVTIVPIIWMTAEQQQQQQQLEYRPLSGYAEEEQGISSDTVGM